MESRTAGTPARRVGVGEVDHASRRCIASKVAGSPVSSRAWASARASIRRDTKLCTGAATSPATVTMASSSATARGSAIESTPARRSSGRPGAEQVDGQTAAAAPERADHRAE